jgi:chromosome segregation protein
VRAEHDVRRKARELEDLNTQRQRETERLEGQIAEARRRREAAAEKMTEMKVALAAVDEKRRAAREALQAARNQVEAMRRDLAADRQQVEIDRRRKAEAESTIEQTRQEVDRLYADQQRLDRESEEVSESRCGLTERIEEIRRQLAEQRKAHAAAAEQANAVKVELGEVEVRIENLIARAAEEMGMDLLKLFESYEHDDERDWDAVEGEIQELRGKIERLGNVNLDAIGEQEELERRREFLGGQLSDVEESRRRLNGLIRRINRESREMFLATFQVIREHFQALFRKLFGGGRADIMMIDPENVLESGIEIIARPPGKELRTLSLLSGGEKTMTALSLMFSIFKSRPSPFCLLDEVDAALDEQNTERFVRLVGEFVENSQFLIISHAKRTMGMADVLYGVTMQDPGVSKRISVRFEDAGEKMEQQLEPVAAP